ncbi:hypothetical protein T440DRAFT_209539 [Plenodomus tracheiphilus IPT5]|uniref:Uncharacterized protein n=1 Tax=Plenodomus tracheiphilus IPT5 TaxID=1408161 RepID=A0A6A7BLJ2_9PLEO|nr:hypothetical protein T440DRAFT_209539 [Plenodomus tracheiphilus IPT5]
MVLNLRRSVYKQSILSIRTCIKLLQEPRRSPAGSDSPRGPKPLSALSGATRSKHLEGSTASKGSSSEEHASISSSTNQPSAAPSSGVQSTPLSANPKSGVSQPQETTRSQASHPTGWVVNVPEDFMLLCFRVKKYLTRRHDLGLSRVSSDRELFSAFRREYHSRRSGWLHRTWSLRTVQRINFVKFVLRPRREIDGLEPGMPTAQELHYTYDPRPPGLIPPIGNNMLMHRFNSPEACYNDDICLKQIPKRVNERPTPGIAPDLHTGWGLHFEEGLDFERICFVLLGAFVSSGLFGLIWAVCKGSLQDGFTVAGFVASGEAVAVASLQLLIVARADD